MHPVSLGERKELERAMHRTGGVLCCDSTPGLCRGGVQFLKELQAANTRLHYCEGSSHGFIKMKCSGTFLRKLKR